MADQGTEKGIADIDQSVNSTLCGGSPLEWTDKLGHLYPNALWMHQHLHILFNALETAVCKLAGHDNWLSLLRAAQNFLSDPTLRRLFIALLLLDNPDLLKYWSTVHIDWRWEMLSETTPVLNFLHIMRDVFVFERFLQSAHGEQMNSNFAKECHAALNSPDLYESSCTVFQHGHILDRVVHRLEGCKCHGGIWKGKGAWAKKRKFFQVATGSKRCHMKGRQAVWFQAVGFDQFKSSAGSYEVDGFIEALTSGSIAS